MSEVRESQPPSRRRVALTVLFHSTCAILSTILSKSALNGIDAPVTLLAFQTSVQVVLITAIGYFTKWINLSRPVSVRRDRLALSPDRVTMNRQYHLAVIAALFYGDGC